MAKFYPGDIVIAFDKVVAKVVCYKNNREVMVKRYDGRIGPAWAGTKYQGLWMYPEHLLELIREGFSSLENE